MDYHEPVNRLHGILRDFFESRSRKFEAVIEELCRSLESGGKILVFGNGGSACQAQHFAAELVNRFLRTRPALPAVALTTDTAALTSISNDETFERVFSRQVEALGKPGDAVLALSTSGNSPSVLRGLEAARKLGLIAVAMTGEGGGQAAERADFLLDTPSRSTPRIQEAHLLLLHLLAGEIESRLFPGAD